MSTTEPKKKMVGPWRSVHGAIWLIGIIIIATHNWWWPGILILFALSGIFEGFLQLYAPEAYVEETPSTPTPQAATPIPPTFQAPTPSTTLQEHRIDLLPTTCPNCNAPIRGQEVKWTGPQSANCPYCGSNLPMNKA